MKIHCSDMEIIQRRLISQGCLSPPNEYLKHFYQRTFKCSDTGNIPDRLLLSRACFCFFPVNQMYAYLVYTNKIKSLYNSEWTIIWREWDVHFFKEKKNQKKKKKRNGLRPWIILLGLLRNWIKAYIQSLIT
jgi:hypothetical protein